MIKRGFKEWLKIGEVTSRIILRKAQMRSKVDVICAFVEII